MNILNWILFILLNVCLASGISGFRLITNIVIWLFLSEECYFCAFLWLLLVFPLQFVFLPILYEFINKKSQIFLFLNKLKNLIFCLKILFVSLVADIFSLFVFSKIGKIPMLQSLFFCFLGSLFAGYFSLTIWLKLRKCILFRLRKIMKFLGKWFDKRKFATLQNIIIALHLIFAAEFTIIYLSAEKDGQLFFPSFVVILSTFALIELISVLSFAKKQKAQPFQRGVIFINSLLVFTYIQLAMKILFIVKAM